MEHRPWAQTNGESAKRRRMIASGLFHAAIVCVWLAAVETATAVTNVFFSGAQTATVVSSNITAITIQSGDYRFTYSVDGYWSSGGGPPTGRFFSVYWPTGVQAQAVTAGPSPRKATITIKRADGSHFELRSFTGKLLANTAATGAAFEIMPQLGGEDALQDPRMFDASGYAGQSFSHAVGLTNYEAYKITLFVDYALTALVLVDAASPPNTPPVALGGNFFQIAGQPLAINLADLMWNDYDPDGGTVLFAGVSATSSNGLALTTNATQILVPPNLLADGFTYTINDGRGGTATGGATIAIVTKVISRVLSLDVASAPGVAVVNGSGIPWYFYECQRATNVTFAGPLHAWQVQASGDGMIHVVDDFTDLTDKPPQAFYRLRFVP
jgi:hypothetical protein